ncbi:MAG: HAMP domain-containing protein [Ignavibacteria bacterium]|nr:HAMP domain-containing protein [Ignavibacteria bacterium]
MVKYFDRKSGILVIAVFLIIIWFIAVQIISNYVAGNTDDNWDEILENNIRSSSETCISVFERYQNKLSEISSRISENPDVTARTENGDGTGLYEIIRKMHLDDDVPYEIYDKRLNLLAFRGKQLNPDNLRLQKVISGNKFSVIKETGFYTYLMIYSPVYHPQNIGEVSGVAVTASLIDVKSEIRNKFFSGFGFTEEVRNKIDANIDLISTDGYFSSIAGQSDVLQYNYSVDLTGIDNTVIGRIDVKGFDRESYRLKLGEFTSKINASLSFLFALCILGLFFSFSRKTKDKYLFVNVIVFSVILFLIRILWLKLYFPSGLFATNLFSPKHFASSGFLGFGKSVGDLFVSLILLLFIIIYSANIYSSKEFIFNPRRMEKTYQSVSYIVSYLLIALVLFFAVFHVTGTLYEGIISDSNINFLDKTSLLSSEVLFVIFAILLIISFASLFFNCSVLIILISKIKNKLTNSALKRFSILFLFIIFTVVNFSLDYIADFELSVLTREIFIIFVFLFAYYIHRFSFLKRNFRLFTFRNFMLIALISVFISPLLMLEKLYDKEPEFLELLGKTLTNQEEDRAVFLISNELINNSQNKNLEALIKDKNSLPKLAYHLWSESRISSENFNSLFIIIDSNKKVLSDFNINPSMLYTDSIVNFVTGKILNKPYDFDISIESTDTLYTNENYETEGDFEYYPIAFENVRIIKNSRDKYYVGITAIEGSRLKGGISHSPLGFVMIVLQSDIKNIVRQSSQQFFKPYSQDNLLTKIISRPILTEFINNEVESASEDEISKEVKLYLNGFLQYVDSTGNRRMWKDMEYENKRYKTFFILSEPENIEGDAFEKGLKRIYTISVKKFDFSVVSFFYLKYILLGILILFLLYLIYGIIFAYKIKNIKINFRSKLLISFLAISVIPILILGVYSRAFLINKNDQNTRDLIHSDLNLVSELLRTAGKTDVSKQQTYSLNAGYEVLLGKYFLKTDKNFNIFVNNKLVTTTNDELYTSDLLDTRIDADAEYNILNLRKEYFIKNQSAGDLTFIEGYKPVLDNENKIKGIISSLSVYRENEISEELTETLTYIFSSYILVIFFILGLVTFFTERLSKPVLELKEAADRVSRGESDVEIKIKNRTDEIGSLVDSFNDMTKKLEKSKEELKRAEREAAWRDIARRVAHEIKNPLTPMKLSIQHLKKSYRTKSREDFNSILDKTERLITNEIDKLNRIATEFSNFAKLPSRDYEPLNVNEILEEVISLYTSHKNIEFKKELSGIELSVMADRQEINRVFHNLLKNSIQAIDDKGIIIVKSYEMGEFAIVEISDNGEGIEPDMLKKLFEPNFSIKSKGMGLGLAITKKSLDDMKAEIQIQSKSGKGTKVSIRFNLYKREDEE